MESTLEALVSRLPTGNESRNSTEPQPPDDDDGFQGSLPAYISLLSPR